MTGETSQPSAAPRAPRIFEIGDPNLAISDTAIEPDAPKSSSRAPGATPATPPARQKFDLERSWRWGTVLVSALSAAASLAAGLWFYHFVAVGLVRDDWIGWTIRGLIAIASLALLMILGREIAGLSRLGRLNRLKAEIAAALGAGDAKRERQAVRRLSALYAGRPELKWNLSRLAEHSRDVHDAGSLFALADRDVMTAIDGAARRQITRSAKRVATVTAMSPIMSLSVGFLAFENLRLLRVLATLYGGRPGFAGGLRLARLVVTTIVAAGGVALTDDLLGQFVGQDVLRRLSRRLGEGAFNGALTARVGVAGITLVRPLPFIEAKPPRVRDILGEVLRRSGDPAQASPDTAKS